MKILLETHRAIRYSVSPRFELETAIAELCILVKWVSQEDLRTAIEGVRSILAVNPSAGAKSAGREAAGQPAGGAERSMTDEFKRRIAARGNSGAERAESRHPREEGGIMPPEVGFVEKVFQATVIN